MGRIKKLTSQFSKVIGIVTFLQKSLGIKPEEAIEKIFHFVQNTVNRYKNQNGEPAAIITESEALEELRTEIEILRQEAVEFEKEKAWSTSSARIFYGTVFTYIVFATTFYFLGIINYFQIAFIPTAGYILYTILLPLFKKWWMASQEKNY